jgi:hypothetical protein
MADGVLHCLGSNGPIAGCNTTGPVLVGKEEQDMDGVTWDILQIEVYASLHSKAIRDGGVGVTTMCRLMGMERPP